MAELTSNPERDFLVKYTRTDSELLASIPLEVADRLRADGHRSLYLHDNGDGSFRLTDGPAASGPTDAEHAEQMRAMREVMDQHRNVLSRLAK